MERLQFSDAFLALDLDGNAGQTYRLYQASFNRTPDFAGLGGWIAAMDAGTTPVQVATSFMASDEFKSLYGASTTDAQFVALLYANALHRAAGAADVGYWVDQLKGAQTRAQVLIAFSESAENKASVLPNIATGIVYTNTAQNAGDAKGLSLSGTSANDTLVGSVGSDTVLGAAGNDTIDGGAGLDTAVFSGTRASHTITATTNASANVKDLSVSSTASGVDTLSLVERLKFDDVTLAFDTSGNAGQTYRLYQAALNRTPDKAGLSDWVKGVDGGLTLLSVAGSFIQSAEFKSLYGANPTDAQFVNLLYTNALHRTADASGLAYWVDQLTSSAQTRAQVLCGFAESAENQASLIGFIQNGIELAG
jgi:Ca2+-binding RTX toxin-like protein